MSKAESVERSEDEASNDTFLIVLLIAGVLAIALLIAGCVARNRNKPPEEG